jgi:hypothetical protein
VEAVEIGRKVGAETDRLCGRSERRRPWSVEASERRTPWNVEAAERAGPWNGRQPPDRSSLRAYSAARGR